MSRYIIKLTDDSGTDWYLEWSSIIDAPATFGKTLAHFRVYYRLEYGSSRLESLEARLVRVEAKGTSSHMSNSVEDVIECNRAGSDENCLTMAEIIHWYCHLQKSPP